MKSPVVPWPTLSALAALVLPAHLWLLGAAQRAVAAPAASTAPALFTRTIAPALPVEVPAVLPPTPQPQAVRVAAVQRVAPARPKPAPATIAVAAGEETTELPAAPIAVAASAQPVTRESHVHAVAFHVPPSARLHYKVTAQARGINLEGDGELQWRHDGDSYEAQLEISSPLLPRRVQQSTGRITAQGLEPLRFSDKARHEEAAHFERDQGKVSFSSNKPDAPLLAGAQDRLSVVLQLGAMIAGDPKKFRPGTSIAIQTASTRDAEPWVFVVEGPEQLQLPGGAVSALKLTRSPRKEFDQRVELWLAPGMDYVPVRLRLTQPNGDWVDQQWSSTDKG